jgi:hypothetical protein
VVESSIVGGGVALSEEVALDICVAGSEPLPIDLVQVVGLENETADGAGTRGSSQHYRDLSKHDVLVEVDRGSVGALGDDELGAQTIVAHAGSIFEDPVRTGTLCEIGRNGRSKARVGGTTCYTCVRRVNLERGGKGTYSFWWGYSL